MPEEHGSSVQQINKEQGTSKAIGRVVFFEKTGTIHHWKYLLVVLL